MDAAVHSAVHCRSTARAHSTHSFLGSGVEGPFAMLIPGAQCKVVECATRTKLWIKLYRETKGFELQGVCSSV